MDAESWILLVLVILEGLALRYAQEHLDIFERLFRSDVFVFMFVDIPLLLVLFSYRAKEVFKHELLLSAFFVATALLFFLNASSGVFSSGLGFVFLFMALGLIVVSSNPIYSNNFRLKPTARRILILVFVIYFQVVVSVFYLPECFGPLKEVFGEVHFSDSLLFYCYLMISIVLLFLAISIPYLALIGLPLILARPNLKGESLLFQCILYTVVFFISRTIFCN
jgi:hypothetical protein